MLNYILQFCEKFLDSRPRIINQVIYAARSSRHLGNACQRHFVRIGIARQKTGVKIVDMKETFLYFM